MTDLKKSFEKESKPKKIILVAAAAALISTFLPWLSVSFGGFGGASVNGWHRFGLLTALASIAIILIWLLPKVGVKFKLPAKEDDLSKILTAAMLGGTVLWLMDSGFEFSFLGIGFYIALAAGVVAVYFAFTSKKVPVKKETTKKKK